MGKINKLERQLMISMMEKLKQGRDGERREAGADAISVRWSGKTSLRT